MEFIPTVIFAMPISTTGFRQKRLQPRNFWRRPYKATRKRAKSTGIYMKKFGDIVGST